MDKLEMIERLRKHADISYEEAKEILSQTEDDLVEAIILLERQGKIRKPASDPSAEKEEQPQTEEKGQPQAEKEERSQEEKEEKTNREKEFSLGTSLRSFFRFLMHTSFHVTRKGENLVTMPSWAFALMLPPFWEIMLPAMLIALFFGCRYSFDGQASTGAANEILEKAGSFADGVESSMKK